MQNNLRALCKILQMVNFKCLMIDVKNNNSAWEKDLKMCSPCSDGVAETHEQQEADPVEEEGGEERREEDEVVAQQRRVRRLQIQRVVEGGEGQ